MSWPAAVDGGAGPEEEAAGAEGEAGAQQGGGTAKVRQGGTNLAPYLALGQALLEEGVGQLAVANDDMAPA